MSDLFESNSTYDTTSAAELLAWLDDQDRSIVLRAQALAALCPRVTTDEALVPLLRDRAMTPELQEARFFHLISLAFLVVACLADAGTPSALAAASQAVGSFSRSDQDSCVRFLASGGLILPG